jgi:hypothetical protein
MRAIAMNAGTKYSAIPNNILIDDYFVALHVAHRSMHEAFNLRSADGLTQDDIAAMLDVDKAFISRRFNGTDNLTLKTLSNMGTALNCRLVILFRPYERVGADNYYTPTQPLAKQLITQ